MQENFLAEGLQFLVPVVFLRWIKRKHAYFVAAGQLAQQAVATDLAARVQRKKAAGFDPEDFHNPPLAPRSGLHRNSWGRGFQRSDVDNNVMVADGADRFCGYVAIGHHQHVSVFDHLGRVRPQE